MNTVILKIISVLWLIWGFVHTFAGVVIISSSTTDAVAAVADAIDPAELASSYHDALGALINQHGFNLFWIGLVTMICAVLIWRSTKQLFYVLLLAAITGGLADVGYFLFMDLGGYVHFMPGTLMTIFSGTAIVLSGWLWWKETTGATTT